MLAQSGDRLGEVDLVDEHDSAAIEVDGADHRDGTQQAWDITKEEGLRQVGFEVTRVTGRQALDHATLAPRLRAVRRRAQDRDRTTRAWGLAPQDFDLEQWLVEREETALFHEHPPERW